MEEADVLCHWIGIVNEGALWCVGPQQRLKSLYGGGYRLFINCHKLKFIKLQQTQEESKEDFWKSQSIHMSEIHKSVEDFVEKLCPNSIMLQNFNGNFIF